MTDKLPGVLQEIAELVGEQAALIIATRFGGTRIYMPTKAGDTHPLVESIGRDAAEKLCEHFMVDGRGQRIDIPLHFGRTYRQLQRAIAKCVHELDDGTRSAPAIARAIGVTTRTVNRHRARHTGSKAEEKPKQGRLL
jgi:1,6-anhydro-N-acetylmuramate kinase